MSEKFIPNSSRNNPEYEIKKLFQNLFMDEETEEIKSLREWVKTVARLEIEKKLESLRIELNALYEEGKVENDTISPKEKELRKKIRILDSHLNTKI